MLEIVVFCFAFIYKDVVSVATFDSQCISQLNPIDLSLFRASQAKDETKSFLETTIKDYRSGGKDADAVSLMWNQLQARFECCGVNSYNDFDRAEIWKANRTTRVVPESCCKLTDKLLIKLEDERCPFSPDDQNSYYLKVCLTFFYKF